MGRSNSWPVGTCRNFLAHWADARASEGRSMTNTPPGTVRLRTTVLLLALAAFVAGCTSTPIEEESLLDSEKAAALIGKLDEALIGTSGPEQIEDAIETLDAQTESDPPLVCALGVTSPPSLPAPSDLFERV